MVTPLLGLKAAAAAAVVSVIVAVPVATVGVAYLSTTSAVLAGGGCGGDGGPGGGSQQVDGQRWTGEQLTNAQTITTVARQRGLPRRAAIIAVATGIVESGLRNLDHGDRDSLGVFQQRPSQGWGTPEQIRNPAYAATTFFDHLLTIPGWATMPPGAAEQAVQRSAFPERYATQDRPAASLVAKYWSGPDTPQPNAGQRDAPAQLVGLTDGGCTDQGGGDTAVDPQKLPTGFVLPADAQLAAAVSYAVAQVGKPYVWGAKGPNAFDCSGLMLAAWAHAGVAIPSGTVSQVHAGRAVGSLNQLQPGDLVFTPGSLGTVTIPRHVGMYAGNGLIVEAYDSDTGVILSPLSAITGKVAAVRRVAASAGTVGSVES